VKYPVTRFKSLEVALKEIEPMVRDPRHLQTGKPLEKFGDMRPREMLANWLLCATFEKVENRKLLFYSDPIGGDGIIRDEATGETWQTEHVYVSQHSTGPDAKALILDATSHKQRNGAAYCGGARPWSYFSIRQRLECGFRIKLQRHCRSRFCSTRYGLSASP
jgi:hypothetical protein